MLARASPNNACPCIPMQCLPVHLPCNACPCIPNAILARAPPMHCWHLNRHNIPVNYVDCKQTKTLRNSYIFIWSIRVLYHYVYSTCTGIKLLYFFNIWVRPYSAFCIVWRIRPCSAFCNVWRVRPCNAFCNVWRVRPCSAFCNVWRCDRNFLDIYHIHKIIASK